VFPEDMDGLVLLAIGALFTELYVLVLLNGACTCCYLNGHRLIWDLFSSLAFRLNSIELFCL
jgi:hypothetical protein